MNTLVLESYMVITIGLSCLSWYVKLVIKNTKQDSDRKKINNKYLLIGSGLAIGSFTYSELMEWILSGFDFNIYYSHDGQISYATYHFLAHTLNYFIGFAACITLLIGLNVANDERQK